jgi:1,6-anhydro-N-acetylmuramate kinase
MATLRALGLMSGTSLDGIDLALIETDGQWVVRRGASVSRPYGKREHDLLGASLEAAAHLSVQGDRNGILAEAEDLVTRSHGEVVDIFLQSHGLKSTDIDIGGFHGQTVVHRPQDHLTVQIGDGRAPARQLGIPVIFDFRNWRSGAIDGRNYGAAMTWRAPALPLGIRNPGDAIASGMLGENVPMSAPAAGMPATDQSVFADRTI